MYYELLQQRYGAGLCKEALIKALAPVGKSIVRTIAPTAAKATGTAAKAIGTTAKATGAAAKRPMRYAGRSGPKVSTTGTAAKRPIIDAELVDDAASVAAKPGIISRLKDFGRQHGKGMAYGAAGTGVLGGTGYGLYNMFGDDEQYTAQEQAADTTPSLTDAQLMAQNGWNGWNWDDLGSSLANYIQSGKVLEHAIPAVLAYIAGRAMS